MEKSKQEVQKLSPLSEMVEILLHVSEIVKKSPGTVKIITMTPSEERTNHVRQYTSHKLDWLQSSVTNYFFLIIFFDSPLK